MENLYVAENVDEVALDLGQAPTTFTLTDGPWAPECGESFLDGGASGKARDWDLVLDFKEVDGFELRSQGPFERNLTCGSASAWSNLRSILPRHGENLTTTRRT